MTTGFLFDERYLWHDTGSAACFLPAGGFIQPETHAENPETKRRFRNLLEVSGLMKSLVQIEPRLATEEEILYFHTPEYVAKVKNLSDTCGGDAGEFTPFGMGSYEIAQLAAGGAIEAVNAVLDGKVDNIYALVRPPGHHAEKDMGRGFCILGNGAIAIKHAQKVRGLTKVATIDWDVHHGNGTQKAFYDDPSVLTMCFHQDDYYPHPSGTLGETGEGPGGGYNINVPLPSGSGHGAYLAGFERVVLPALKAFQPDLIMVMSGFDANGLDPLGRMQLYSGSYRAMTKMLKETAAEVCGGRLVMLHEGGYSTAYVPFCGLATMEELSGVKTEVVDPFEEFFQGVGGQDLLPHQEEVINQAAQLAAKLG